MGQLPFAPPSVGGWPSGSAWLGTAATQTRLRLAAFFAARADVTSRSSSRSPSRIAWTPLPGCLSWTRGHHARGQLSTRRMAIQASCSRSPCHRPSTPSREAVSLYMESCIDLLTRRRFLAASGVVGATALAAGASWRPLSELLAAGASTPAGSTPPRSGERILVLVTLYGGNDSLGMLVPYADPAYHDARPELAYSADEVLHLDDAVGLNPEMDRCPWALGRRTSWPWCRASGTRSRTAAISARWTSGRAGRPGIRSTPAGSAAGWTRPVPIRCALYRRVGAAAAHGRRDVRGSGRPARTAVRCRRARSARESPHCPNRHRASQRCRPRPRGESRTCFASSQRYSRSPASPASGASGPAEDESKAAGASAGGQGALGAATQTSSSGASRRDTPTRVYAVSLGGFDTHADEKGTQSRLLGELDTALTGFLDSVETRSVVVAVYSEFGRRVEANASQGTDHGTAGTMLIAGPASAVACTASSRR